MLHQLGHEILCSSLQAKPCMQMAGKAAKYANLLLALHESSQFTSPFLQQQQLLLFEEVFKVVGV